MSYPFDVKTTHYQGAYIGDPGSGQGYELPTTSGNVGDVLTCQGNGNVAQWTPPSASGLPPAAWPGAVLQNIGGVWKSSPSLMTYVSVPSGVGSVAAFKVQVNTTNNGIGKISFSVLIRNSDDTHDYLIEDGIYSVSGGNVQYNPILGTQLMPNNSVIQAVTVSGNPLVLNIPKDSTLTRQAAVKCEVTPHAVDAVSFV